MCCEGISEIGGGERELGVGFEEAADAVGAVEGAGEEGDGLLDAVVGLGATEAEEAGAGGAEAFAAEAGDAERVVGPLEQVECQAVRRQAQAVANLADVGKT